MEHSIDKKYMQQCIILAKKGFGTTYPNPMVGCVIVYNNQIIGKGYHKKAGGKHAEVLAIESVEDKSLLSKSTLYVNLEPCSHYGKTPPCVLSIVQYKIPKVVIGCIDTYAQVSGRGVEFLQKNGVEVTVGVMEKESIELNKRFFTFHSKQRPYIILKWAQTKDGYIDLPQNQKQSSKGIWITDNICKKLVHTWRTQEQAILVGTNTARIDNPQLTARLSKGLNPLRVVIDLHDSLPDNLHVKNGSTPTIIFTRKSKLSSPNLEYKSIPNDENNVWNFIFKELYVREIQSIIIEGGAFVLQDCIDKNLWDEMRVFVGPIEFGNGVLAPKIKNQYSEKHIIGNSELLLYYSK